MWSTVFLSFCPKGFLLKFFLGLGNLAAVLYCVIGSNRLFSGGLVPSAIIFLGKGGLWFSFPLHS